MYMLATKARRRISITRLGTAFLATLGFLLGGQVTPAPAAVGLEGLDVTFTDAKGALVNQAGAHPYAMTTSFTVPTVEDPTYGTIPQEGVKNVVLGQIPGFVGNQTAVPPCDADDFLNLAEGRPSVSECSDSTVVGRTIVTAGDGETIFDFEAPVYNLAPPPGAAAKLGFTIMRVPVTVEVGVDERYPHALLATSANISQALEFYGIKLTLWGVPADPAHDEERGRCYDGSDTCPAGVDPAAFLTLPRACAGPLASQWKVNTWLEPDVATSGSTLTHDDAEPPNPAGMSGCGKLGFAPRVEATPTSRAAQSPTGLEFTLEFDNEGLGNPSGIADSDLRRAKVMLPEGVTANPSVAEGLEVCSEADVARETFSSSPGAGCPEAAKIGTVEVVSPLVEESLSGSLYIAEPYENRFETLLALYFVIKNRELGINIVQAAKVEPDPATGRLVTTVENVPQLPFSRFTLRFREGGRSPLITPPSCDGDPALPGNQPFVTVAELTPWANPGATYTATSSFQLISGPNRAPCPQGSTPPFDPGFSGGTVNNAAGSYSPFLLGLSRKDGDQDLVRFDASLPPGALAKLAGVSFCSEAAISRLRARTGRQEQARPSCPVDSKIGTVQAGAGVGSQLTYVAGSVYLAGPFGGAPLSVVGVVPAVAGPFDVGVVTTRQALTVDPVTGVAKVDGARSDPIPHILAGIPLAVREIQVAVDRPEFTINPTNCEPLSFGASIWGGGADTFSLGDDRPISRSERYQAADCASLGFKPRLQIELRGGAKRGDNPALRAIFTPRPGDANLKRTVVKLPRSVFLEQGHIRTICTRAQWAVDTCPRGSIYGRVEARTPLLAEPLKGNAYLRSSSNTLPDLVFDFKGLVEIEAAARIDSVKGGIRATFPAIPDAPISSVVVSMFGGEKSLIANSRNLCHRPKRNKAELTFGGQNGKVLKARPVVQAAACAGKGRNAARRSSHRRGGGA